MPQDNYDKVLSVYFYLRLVTCFIPAVIICPICDFLTCWRFMLTSRATYFIQYGIQSADSGPKKTLQDFQHNANIFTDGTIVFNLYDLLFQIIYGPILILSFLMALLLDIFTCNSVRVTARVVPELRNPVFFMRWGIEQICCRKVTWWTDAAWKECCTIVFKNVLFSVAQTL